MKYKLISITTNKFNFKNKLLDGKEYTLKPIFNRNISKIDNKYSLTLSVSIHDYESSISPYDIDLSIEAIFELIDGTEAEKLDFMKINAISIVFPYLRSCLSVSMSSLMLQPIILPVVNILELFKN